MQSKRTKANRRDSDGPPIGPPADLYRQDFHAWASDQARALRQAADSRARGDTEAFREAIAGLDLENLAEEIAGLAKSEQSELRHRLTTVVEHLLKLQHSSAPEPRAGWRNTVRHSRIKIARLLEDSPSLKAKLPDALDKAREDGRALAPGALKDCGEDLTDMAQIRGMLLDYTLKRVLDPDWWPPMVSGT